MFGDVACRGVARRSWVFRGAGGWRGFTGCGLSRRRFRGSGGRFWFFLALVLRLQVQRRAVAVFNFVSADVVQCRLHDATEPVKVIFLLVGEARAVQHKNRLESSVCFRLALSREFRRVRRRILGSRRGRSWRWRILRARRTDGWGRHRGGGCDGCDGGSQGSAARELAAGDCSARLFICRSFVRRRRWVGLFGHRILSGVCVQPREGSAAKSVAQKDGLANEATESPKYRQLADGPVVATVSSIADVAGASGSMGSGASKTIRGTSSWPSPNPSSWSIAGRVRSSRLAM